MFPRCRRPRARDPRGALDHMRLGSPHTDLRWHPYRVQGGGLTGEHRLTAGVRSYRLGRVATGCNQGDARVGCIVCSMTASSPTERESGSELLAQAGGECLHSAGGVVAAAADAPVDHVCTRGAATRQRSPARGGTAALTPAQPTTRGRPPPVPDGKQRLGQRGGWPVTLATSSRTVAAWPAANSVWLATRPSTSQPGRPASVSA